VYNRIIYNIKISVVYRLSEAFKVSGREGKIHKKTYAIDLFPIVKSLLIGIAGRYSKI
jgi:hypothetical protein